MQSNRIIIEFDKTNNYPGCIFEAEMPDIGHLSFEGSPETLDGLIVAWGSRSRHTLAKASSLYQLFRAQGGILTALIAVKYGSDRTRRVTTYRHVKRILNQGLGLSTIDRPSDDPAGSNVDNAANIQLAVSVTQFRNIGTPEVIGHLDRELIFDQILLNVAGFLGFQGVGTTFSTTFGH